jgi:hypothetical protein
MAVLARAARADVSQTDAFLFHRQGRDWRWISFAAAESRLAAGVPGVADWPADPVGAALAALSSGEEDPAIGGLLERLPPSRRRDILVLDRPPAVAAGSLLLGWAAAAGAAVVLEPDSERRAATIAWVRPSIVAGSAAELRDLGERLRSLGDAVRLRRRRAPLGRLRAVVVLEPSDGVLGEPWSSIGVATIAAG